MVENVSLDELKQKMDKGAVTLVDALPAEAYEKSHLPGAVSLPYDLVERSAKNDLPDLNAEIIVYCAKPT